MCADSSNVLKPVLIVNLVVRKENVGNYSAEQASTYDKGATCPSS